MTEEENSLDLLIKHEMAMEQLYKLFADMFSEQQAFWQGIVEDEKKHVDCLNGLSSKESVRKWFRDDGRLKRLAIGRSIEYIEQQIERVLKANISPLEALAIANGLEEALIEKQFISLNISGSEEIRNVMKGLVADTQRHRKMIAENLNLHKHETP